MILKLLNGIVLFSLLVSIVLCQFDTRYRIPKTTYPIDYNIWLNVSLESDAFNGEVEIDIGVASFTNQITLRQYNIKLNKFELFRIDGISSVNIPITQGVVFIEHTLQLISNDLLEVGKKYRLKFAYTSKSVDSMRGLFRSINRNSITGEETTILASNFLAQYASSVFPCYDDPEFRATFTLSIQHPVGYYAISNMPVSNAVTTNTFVTTSFQKTPLLAAHSIALSVLNYHLACDNNSDFEICAYYDDHHTVDDVQLVLQTANDVLNELAAYLDFKLVLPKLDLIPIDTSAPTIGHYGLLINRLSDYYYNPKTSNVAQKDRVIRQIIRHIVNLYFVNIVTPEWWDSIWINNGISLILEHTIADKLYPETEATNEFINCLYEYATGRVIYFGALLDLLGIEDLLGKTIQHRSAAIMYMFKNFVGDDIFKTGLNKLLSGSIKSFNSQTFFNIFQSLNMNVDLNSIMNTWIKQDSYPILNVQRDYDINAVILTQDNVLNVYDNYGIRNQIYGIPVNSITKNDNVMGWLETSGSDWLNTKTLQVNFSSETLNNSEWIIYNKELSGFYHTNYDTDNWNLLATQLYTDFTLIPWITRTQLLHDSILFALNGKLKLDVIFKIANYTNREFEYAPLTRFISGFNKLDAEIFGTSVYTNFTKFTLHKIRNLYMRVRVINLFETFHLSITDLKLRNSLIDMACHMGLELCLLDTYNLLKTLVATPNGLEILFQHEFGSTILYNGMALADIILFWDFFAIRDQLKFNDFAEALGHIQNNDVIDVLLTVLITRNGEEIGGVEINLTQDERRIIFEKLISYNLVALDKVLTFVIDSADLIKELWFTSNRYSIPFSLMNMIKTEERLEKFLEIDNIYQGGRAATVITNVELTNTKISEFETTLNQLVEYIDCTAATAGAVTITLSTFLLTALVIIVRFYQ